MSERLPHAPVVKVVVTAEMIAAAKRKDSAHCMISDAIREAIPNAASVASDIQTIRFTDREKGLRYVYITPRMAQMELVRFDQGIESGAFAFQLRNGSVFNARKYYEKKKKKKLSQKQQEAVKKMLRSRFNNKKDFSRVGKTPSIIGGREPLSLPPSHRRREFGLRAFGDLARMAVAGTDEKN